MTDLEKIKEFKEQNYENMTRLISAAGGLPPVCTLLLKNKDGHKVMIAPVPDEAMSDERNKQKFVDIMPAFFKQVEKDGFTILCFSYSSEAWLRKMKPDTKDVPDNWKSFPKVEVLITSYETEGECEVEVNEIVREGKIANDKGKLIDCIVLKKYEDMDAPANDIGGRFSNLYTNYVKSKNKNKDE